MKRDDFMSDEAVSAYYENFQTRLAALREKLGYSQVQFAELLGMPPANYIKYETRPKSKFPLHYIERLALVTRSDIDFLVTGRNVRSFRRA